MHVAAHSLTVTVSNQSYDLLRSVMHYTAVHYQHYPPAGSANLVLSSHNDFNKMNCIAAGA